MLSATQCSMLNIMVALLWMAHHCWQRTRNSSAAKADGTFGKGCVELQLHAKEKLTRCGQEDAIASGDAHAAADACAASMVSAFASLLCLTMSSALLMAVC